MPPAKGHGGHGGGARRKKHGGEHGEEEGGSERWLVTYADMLTLLLVLFIVLFSISVVNTSKYIALKTSLAAVFGDGKEGILSGGDALNDTAADNSGQQLVQPGSQVVVQQQNNNSVPSTSPVVPSSGYTKAQVTREVSDYQRIQKAVNDSLDKHGMKGAVHFGVTSRGLVMTVITSDLVFPGNSATLLNGGQRILAAIAPPLRSETREIEVDGYTNQQKVSTYPYPTGWELSSARASAVVRQLVADGIGENRLSAVGYSDQHPLYPPSDPRSITLNRRVEIVALSSLPSTAGADLQAAAKKP